MKPLPRTYRISVGFLTLSAILQLVFIAGIWARVITLDHSLRFATVGIPCSVIAIFLSLMKEKEFGIPRGASIGSVLGLMMWLFLVTVH